LSLSADHKEGEVLVLTRRRDEAIVIRNRFGTEIRLLVVDVKGSKVRLGIEAPPEVNIAREEVRPRESRVETVARVLAFI
jgi:carbon storage regulator